MSERETVKLTLDENNELLFKVTVQGTSTTSAKVRLVCEDDDVSYGFVGQRTEADNIRFKIPRMSNRFNEGKTYPCRIEVMVDNRYFIPVEFDVMFRPALKVVAEHVVVSPAKQPPPMDRLVTAKRLVSGLSEDEMDDVARRSVRRLLGK